MRRCFASAMLWLALVLPDALSYCFADPAADLRIARIEAALEDQRLHGYVSPVLAVTQLLDAADQLDGSEPLELRARYHAVLAELALLGRDSILMQGSVEELSRLASDEACAPCQAHALILRARQGINENRLAAVSGLLDQAELLVNADSTMRLKLLQAELRYQEARGMLASAVATAADATSLAESMGNVADQVKLLDHFARLTAVLGNHARALTLVEEAQVIARSIGFIDAQANLYLDEGHIHALTGERAKQVVALRNALSIAEDNPGLSDVEVITLSNLSDYYLSLRDFRRALEYADRAAALAQKAGILNGQIVAMANQGLAMAGLGDIAGGIARLEQALQTARSADHIIYEVGIAAELARVLEQDGQYAKALQTMHEVAGLNARITQQERQKAVVELQESYDNERKDREIERLSAQAELKRAELDARNWRQRLWAALAFALGLAALLMAQWLKRSKEANRRLSIDNANLVEQNVIDALTGAFNRRYFHTLVEQAVASQHHGPGRRVVDREVGMMVLDIDHFKAVNDTHGHVTGDEVLVQMVDRLRRLLRDSDAVVRWGGEEFVLVLPGTLTADLQTLAKRILAEMSNRPFATSVGPVTVTVSLGCVAFPATDDTQWEEAMRMADAAMYQAKQNGRNRAVCVQRVDSSTGKDAVHKDLLNAEHEGKVRLCTVFGAPEESLDTPQHAISALGG